MTLIDHSPRGKCPQIGKHFSRDTSSCCYIDIVILVSNLQAVIDGTWTSDHKSAKELWRKLRNILKSMAAFKRGLKTPDLMSFHGSSENIGKGANVQETASEGTCSDAGYSSLVSMEDLSRTQPVAGGLFTCSVIQQFYLHSSRSRNYSQFSSVQFISM